MAHLSRPRRQSTTGVPRGLEFQMGWVNVTDLLGTDAPTRKEIDQVLDYRRRKAKARFYADEDFPTSAVELLRNAGLKVVTVQELGHRQHPDENHAAYALKNGYILLTRDRDYLNEARFPLIHCPTIVVFDFGSGSREEIQHAFTCVHRIIATPQFFDKWTKIDAGRESWVEYCRTLDGRTHRSRCRVYEGDFQEWVEGVGGHDDQKR